MNAKRGYVPEDERNFAPEAIHTMQTASRHVRYLINEDYDLKQDNGTYVRIENMEVKTIPVVEHDYGFRTR